jgi:ornithine cyclodeaminase/alanine dehydrogenase-like protein (mu-crystallin family)
MPILLTEADVARLLDMPSCIEAVQEAFGRQDAGLVLNHPRRRLHMPDGIFHTMQAADMGLGRMAIKTYSSFRPKTRFLVLLYDAVNGDLLALIEADRLGQMRTGAATGVATKFMARQDAAVLALFGAGWQAESQALAVSAVRALNEIRVFSRTPEARQDFASRLNAQTGVECRAVDSPGAALEDADIVVTATTSRTPVFDGGLLPFGAHVNAVGSNSLTKAEVDMAAVTRATRVVVDSLEQSKKESGDLLGPIEARTLHWEEVVELREIVSGRRTARESPDEITLFKSNGLALEDLAAASLVYDRAVEQGFGQQINLWA